MMISKKRNVVGLFGLCLLMIAGDQTVTGGRRKIISFGKKKSTNGDGTQQQDGDDGDTIKQVRKEVNVQHHSQRQKLVQAAEKQIPANYWRQPVEDDDNYVPHYSYNKEEVEALIERAMEAIPGLRVYTIVDRNAEDDGSNNYYPPERIIAIDNFLGEELAHQVFHEVIDETTMGTRSPDPTNTLEWKPANKVHRHGYETVEDPSTLFSEENLFLPPVIKQGFPGFKVEMAEKHKQVFQDKLSHPVLQELINALFLVHHNKVDGTPKPNNHFQSEFTFGPFFGNMCYDPDHLGFFQRAPHVDSGKLASLYYASPTWTAGDGLGGTGFYRQRSTQASRFDDFDCQRMWEEEMKFRSSSSSAAAAAASTTTTTTTAASEMRNLQDHDEQPKEIEIDEHANISSSSAENKELKVDTNVMINPPDYNHPAYESPYSCYCELYHERYAKKLRDIGETPTNCNTPEFVDKVRPTGYRHESDDAFELLFQIPYQFDRYLIYSSWQIHNNYFTEENVKHLTCNHVEGRTAATLTLH